MATTEKLPLCAQAAQDVADFLNAQSDPDGVPWNPTGAVVRRVYLPAFTPSKLKTLEVRVCPNEITREPAARSYVQKDISVHIGLAQKLPAPMGLPNEDTDNPFIEAIDETMLAAEQVADLFVLGFKLSTCGASWIKTDQPVLFDRNAFRVDRVLLTWVTVTFRLVA